MPNIKDRALQWACDYEPSADALMPQRHARWGFEAGAEWMQRALEMGKQEPVDLETKMLEPTRPDPERLSEALHCADTLDLPVTKILAEALRWQEWAANKWKGRSDYRWPNDLGWDGMADCLQQLKLHIQTISRQAGKLERLKQDYIDSVAACLQAAGASTNLDVLEAQVKEAGTKPSHFIKQQMDELQASNTEMGWQLRDKDLCAERQHRQWDEKMRNLQDKFDTLQGRNEASDVNVTSLTEKFERIGEALRNFNEPTKK